MVSVLGTELVATLNASDACKSRLSGPSQVEPRQGGGAGSRSAVFLLWPSLVTLAAAASWETNHHVVELGGPQS